MEKQPVDEMMERIREAYGFDISFAGFVYSGFAEPTPGISMQLDVIPQGEQAINEPGTSRQLRGTPRKNAPGSSGATPKKVAKKSTNERTPQKGTPKKWTPRVTPKKSSVKNLTPSKTPRKDVRDLITPKKLTLDTKMTPCKDAAGSSQKKRRRPSDEDEGPVRRSPRKLPRIKYF